MRSRALLRPLLALLSVACASGPEPPIPFVGGAPAEPPPVSGERCAVELSRVAAYQSVEIALGQGDAEIAMRNADLIAGKPALFRVFVTPTTAGPVEVQARLTVRSQAGARAYDARSTVTAPSAEDALSSTLDFEVPGADLSPGATASVELVEPGCAGLRNTRFPRSGETALRPRLTGTLRVRLVPIRYDADGSSRLPDTSAEQLARFHEILLAMFPVAAVELTIREALPSLVALTPTTGWTTMLDAVRSARSHDHAPEDLYYFGLVAPAVSNAPYCGTGCMTGLSYSPGPREPQIRVSLGLGFTGNAAAEIMAHELGHAHGRAHAPCGDPKNPDLAFPYHQGEIGVWGYDSRGTARLRPPPSTWDIMSYCGPRWISDYTYRALTERSAQVNRTAPDTPVELAGGDDAAGAPK